MVVNHSRLAILAMFLTPIAACVDLDADANGDGSSPELVESSATEELSLAVTADATFSDCPEGDICFFTEKNGRGDMCNWNTYDEDWTSGFVRCSWATTKNVCSVFNRTRFRVEYFKSAKYEDRVGSTRSGVAGNLACTYKLRSHRYQ